MTAPAYTCPHRDADTPEGRCPLWGDVARCELETHIAALPPEQQMTYRYRNVRSAESDRRAWRRR